MVMIIMSINKAHKKSSVDDRSLTVGTQEEKIFYQPIRKPPFRASERLAQLYLKFQEEQKSMMGDLEEFRMYLDNDIEKNKSSREQVSAHRPQLDGTVRFSEFFPLISDMENKNMRKMLPQVYQYIINPNNYYVKMYSDDVYGIRIVVEDIFSVYRHVLMAEGKKFRITLPAEDTLAPYLFTFDADAHLLECTNALNQMCDHHSIVNHRESSLYTTTFYQIQKWLHTVPSVDQATFGTLFEPDRKEFHTYFDSLECNMYTEGAYVSKGCFKNDDLIDVSLSVPISSAPQRLEFSNLPPQFSKEVLPDIRHIYEHLIPMLEKPNYYYISSVRTIENTLHVYIKDRRGLRDYSLFKNRKNIGGWHHKAEDDHPYWLIFDSKVRLKYCMTFNGNKCTKYD